MNQRLRELMDNIPEHIDRSVDLYVALLKKVNNLRDLANEKEWLEHTDDPKKAESNRTLFWDRYVLTQKPLTVVSS